MKTLIMLQLRKNSVSFRTLITAMLASIPLALLIKSGHMPSREAVNLAMFYWLLAGIPLGALALAGSSGAGAAKETAFNTEQILPVPQYTLLLSSLAAVLLQVAALILAAYAIMGFALPLAEMSFEHTQVYRFYLFSMAYLVLYGFTLSYAFKNGMAGAGLAAAAAAATVVPLVTMSVFQEFSFKILPLIQLKLFICASALAGGAAALKILSGTSDRQENKSAGKLFAAALLLAAPALTTLASLAVLNIEVRKIMTPVPSNWFFPNEEKYLPGSSAGKEAPGAVLVQKPFSGEVFMIDESGRRAVIDPGTTSSEWGYILFPNLKRASAKRLTDDSGTTWILYSGSDGRELFGGNMDDGFKPRAKLGQTWSMHFISGKVPGILDEREGSHYYAALPPQKDGLKWEKIPGQTAEAYGYIAARYARKGETAVFEKDMRTLVSGGKHWTLPDARATGASVRGIKLNDGINFLVPRKNGDRYTTYLCRPDGKVSALWPHYFQLPGNLSTTPDGTVYGTLLTPVVSGEDLRVKSIDPEFYILKKDGETISGVRTGRILEKTGLNYEDISLLRADDSCLWFNAGDKYLVKARIGNTEDFTLWPLPPSIKGRSYSVAVSASANGIFIVAKEGVYFMNWEGGLKKLF